MSTHWAGSLAASAEKPRNLTARRTGHPEHRAERRFPVVGVHYVDFGDQRQRIRAKLQHAPQRLRDLSDELVDSAVRGTCTGTGSVFTE